MELGDWRRDLAVTGGWQHQFGGPDMPVRVAALEPDLGQAIDAIRTVFDGDALRIVVVGPEGSGKSLLLSALVAEAEHRGRTVATLTSTSDRSMIRQLAQGELDVFAVNRLDLLPWSVQEEVLTHRHRCKTVFLATAEIAELLLG